MKAAYYRINLNKASNRLDQADQARRKKRIAIIASFFLLLIIGMSAVVYRTYLTQQVIKADKAQLQEIEDKIEKLEASSDYISPEDIYLLNQVARNRRIWSDKLSILDKALPKDVAITEMNFDASLNTFVIKGISKVKLDMKDLDLVVGIIDLLKSQQDFYKDFSEVKFQMSQRIKYHEQEMVRFEIACLLKA